MKTDLPRKCTHFGHIIPNKRQLWNENRLTQFYGFVLKRAAKESWHFEGSKCLSRREKRITHDNEYNLRNQIILEFCKVKRESPTTMNIIWGIKLYWSFCSGNGESFTAINIIWEIKLYWSFCRRQKRNTQGNEHNLRDGIMLKFCKAKTDLPRICLHFE